MKRLILLVGPPGSGKSTLANNYVVEASYWRVNQDEQGQEGHLREFNKHLELGADVIIDRMNFNKEQRNRYLEPAKAAGYSTKIIVLHVPKDICSERMFERVGHPTIKDDRTASKVLNFFFKSYERVTDDEADIVERLGWVDKTVEAAVICDLDGTLCNVDHRLKYVKGDPGEKKNWKMFFEKLSEDPVNEWCKEILYRLGEYNPIILASGRPDNHKSATTQWLIANDIHYNRLFMRQRDDFRPDTVAKEIILDFEILTRYNVMVIIDDRKSVVDMWRSRGLTVLHCAEGEF